MFQIKDFTSITAGMINHVRGVQSPVTDFNKGAIIRTILEAIATEIDEGYQQVFNGLLEAIPVATYQSFDFSALPAVPTSGPVQLVIQASSQAVTIAAGTVFTPASGSSMTYTNDADVVIAAGGSSASITIIATEAGVAGNLPEGTQFTLSPAPTGFVSCSNPAIFNNGQDAETPAEQKARFVSYVQTLQRVTNAGLEYGAKTVTLYDANGVQTEKVASAVVIEPYVTDNTQPISLINVYVHNGVGSTSSNLVTQADSVLRGYIDANGNKVPGYKAAGVKMVTAAATEQPINTTGAITLLPGAVSATVVAAAKLAMQQYLLGLAIGVPSLYKDRVVLINGIAGVDNIVFSDGLGDVQPTAGNYKLMPGTITFTAS